MSDQFEKDIEGLDDILDSMRQEHSRIPDAIETLEEMTEEEEEKLERLMKTLGRGGLFRKDTIDLINKSRKLTKSIQEEISLLEQEAHGKNEAEAQEKLLERIHKNVEALRVNAIHIVSLMHQEVEDARRFREALEMDITDERRILRIVRELYDEEKLAYDPTTNISGALHKACHAKGKIFHQIEDIIRTKMKRVSQMWIALERDIPEHEGLAKPDPSMRAGLYTEVVNTVKTFLSHAEGLEEESLKELRATLKDMRGEHKLLEFTSKHYDALLHHLKKRTTIWE